MQKYIIKLALIILSFFSFNSQIHSFESIAKEAYLIDISTGQVLLEKNSNKKTFPSSMTKMMTVLIVFEKIHKGEISLEQGFLVSKKAWRMGGSKMFVEVDKTVSIEDLLRGVIVQSGNDASIVLAEGISGSEELFAIEMNLMAKKMGLTGSNFINSSGMPADNHYSTAKDLAIIAQYTIENYPNLFKIYSEKEFTFNNINQMNRNPLLGFFKGNDGLKTGYTAKAGYGYVGSAIRDGRRLILVLNGLQSSNQRKKEANRLMEWGFNNFRYINFFDKDDLVFQADTWLGKDKKVSLITPKNISLSIPTFYFDSINVSVEVEEPVQTPILAGQEIGKLVIRYGDEKSSFNLISEKKIKQKNFIKRSYSALYYLIFGKN